MVVSDTPNTGDASLTTVLSVLHGTITVAGALGSGTGTVTLTGTAAAIDNVICVTATYSGGS